LGWTQLWIVKIFDARPKLFGKFAGLLLKKARQHFDNGKEIEKYERIFLLSVAEKHAVVNLELRGSYLL
jgi:hypothetical protein